MTRVFILPLLFLMSLYAHAQSYQKLRDEAGAQAEKGNYAQAIALSEKAMVQASGDKKTEAEIILSMKAEQASYYLLSEQVEKGMALFAPLLNEVSAGKFPLAEMNVRQNYGIALVFLGSYSEALPQLQRAVELSAGQQIKAEDKVAIQGAIALCYQYQYDFAKSEAAFKEALATSKKEGLARTADHASLLGNFALLYSDMQVPDKAIELFTEGEKIFMSCKDTVDPRFAVFLSDFGTVLADYNQYEKALGLSFRARNIDRLIFTGNSAEYAGALNNIGYIYSRMNKIIETEQFYEAAIGIKKTLHYLRADSYLTTVSNLMVFYARVGRMADARQLAEELEKGLKNKTLTDTLKRAVFANNLALHFLSSDYEKSQKYFKEALKYYAAVYGAGNAMEAEIYVNMGTLFQVQGKYEECTQSLNKAAGVFKQYSQEDDPSVVNTLCNLVFILHNIEQYKQAEPIINRALDLAKKFGITQSGELEQLYLAKAQICADLNQVTEAMTYFNNYLDLKYSQMEQDFSYMTESEKMFFLDQFEQEIKNFYATVLSHIDRYPELIKTLLDFRLRTKAFLLNNLSKIKQRLREQNDPVMNNKFEQLKLKRESVARLMNFNTSEYADALAEAEVLKKESDQLEKEISLKMTGLALSESIKKINWKGIREQLLPGEAAIEILQSYLMYDKGQGKGTNYTYLIIKSKGDPVFVSIDRKVTWEAEVLALYRSSINEKKNEPDLYRRLWQAVDEKLGDIRTVYISPDGLYNEVNLNTLFNAGTSKYLLEEKDLHLLTSLRDLKSLKASQGFRPQYAVLVGNPKFDEDLVAHQAAKNDPAGAVATRGAYGFVLNELPGTKTEVEVIKTTLEKEGLRASMFTEVHANEHDIKALKNPDVLHMATHGFFLEDPKEEDLAGYSKMEKEYYQNPMMRSGIFFSGANNTYTINTGNINGINDLEDGILTAYEAMNLALDKTELVVLSACQTGLGKVKNGEGVYGLQRAFKLAGAKSIIMSLWPVSDEATRDLMIAFYAAWAKSGNLYKAFREAQLETKKKYPEPYYWGAFVLNGR